LVVAVIVRRICDPIAMHCLVILTQVNSSQPIAPIVASAVPCDIIMEDRVIGAPQITVV